MIMAVDALNPRAIMTSTVRALAIYNKWLLIFHEKGTTLPILILKNYRNPKYISMFPKKWNSITMVNTWRPRQDGCHFPDDIFKWIFLNEYVWILIKISMKFVPKGPFNNIPALVQIMAWRHPGDKPFSEPMMVSLWTHICATRPQWVNRL